MSRDIELIGGCPKCDSDQLACRYNHFETDALRIISWEHKCSNCGFRETKAFRSDDEPTDDESDPTVCPYCRRPSPF